jgi:hypothetical protein
LILYFIFISSFSTIRPRFSGFYCILFLYSFLLDALEAAHRLGMSYFKALSHHWIGLSMDIRDTQKDVQIKLRHRDTAMEMFISLNVNESQLLW